MEQAVAEAFLYAHSDVLKEQWTEAKAKGLEDLVFVWIVEPDERDETQAKLFSKYMAREEAYALAKDQDIPEYTKDQLSRVAGPNRAWMLLMTPEGVASMRVTYLDVNPHEPKGHA